jgi:hypothetical protein
VERLAEDGVSQGRVRTGDCSGRPWPCTQSPFVSGTWLGATEVVYVLRQQSDVTIMKLDLDKTEARNCRCRGQIGMCHNYGRPETRAANGEQGA